MKLKDVLPGDLMVNTTASGEILAYELLVTMESVDRKGEPNQHFARLTFLSKSMLKVETIMTHHDLAAGWKVIRRGRIIQWNDR